MENQEPSKENTENVEGGTLKYVECMIRTIKEKIKDGNVDRIHIMRNGEILVNIPVNVGIVGGVIGMYTVPWALILSAVTAFGFGCTLEFVKKDIN